MGIKDLKRNLGCGPDGIYSEHLIHSHPLLSHHLARVFSSLIIHGTLPTSLMNLVITPFLKDKKGTITSRENYRPISKASVMSKLLENILLSKVSSHICSSPNQYGYKSALGTDSCILTLKETITKYKEGGSNIFVAFLDASKAFDRVHHGLLFQNLTDRGVPSALIPKLWFWYFNQNMKVKWGKSYSFEFGVSNGVRQGGILSPFLFNLYLHKLSQNLNNIGTGCVIDGVKINHLYADDLVLISPSSWGEPPYTLQRQQE